MSDDFSDGEEFSLNPEDIVKVIDLDDIQPNGHDINNGSQDEINGYEDDGNIIGDEDGDEMEMEASSSATAITPSQDDSTLTFAGHKDNAVICCEMHPLTSDMAVTGGQDDKAVVWNTKTGTTLFHCTGHTDTVSSVGFSHNGKMVATADMKGLVQVWSVPAGELVWSFEVGEIEWIEWHRVEPVLFAGTKDGEMWMWKVPSGDCKTFPSHGHGALCGRILPDDKRCCVGYEDGVIKIWDLKGTGTHINISGHEGHSSPVLCMDTRSNHVVTGSEDMTVKVISLTHGKVISTLECGNVGQGEDTDSVEAVGLSAVNDYVATGTLSGRLDVWDLSTKSVRQRYEHPYGIVKLKWSPSSPVFYTACLDGQVRRFDSRSGQLVRTWQGHTAAVLDFDIAKDESCLMTSSDDFTAKIYSL